MNFARRLYSLFDARARIRLMLVCLLILGGAGLEAVGTGLILPFIGLINDPTYLDRQPMLASLYSASGMTTPEQFSIACASALLAVFGAKNAYLAVMTVVQNRFVYSELVSTSRRLYGVYMRSPYVFHVQHNTAILIRNVSNEVLMVYMNVVMPAIILLTDALVVVAILIVLLWLSPGPALVSIGFLGSLAGGFYYVVRRKVRRYGVDQQANIGEKIKWINQGLGGIKEITILGREEYFIDCFHRSNTAFAEASRYAMVLNQMPRLFIETVAVATLLLAIVFILWTEGEAHRLLPTIALFAVAAFRLLPSINRIINSATRIAYYRPAVDVVQSDLTSLGMTPTRVDRIEGRKFSFQQNIEFDDVTYSYPLAASPALDGVTLSIPKGSAVAIVGPSGAGKTTFVDVLLGLLSPDRGCVRVDGRDTKENLREWQSKIGYIPQTIYLSDDTVRRNIAFGVPDELIAENAVWAALRSARLDEHIRSLPEGLDAIVGERGVKLSGGQRQRIGIARALYHDPEVLIFDEATSALDAETEQEISKTIEKLRDEKTLIIIAHRQSTIEKCSIRYELHEGKVIR